MKKEITDRIRLLGGNVTNLKGDTLIGVQFIL